MFFFQATGNLVLPDSSFLLFHRDDTVEFDEDIQSDRDEPKFVVWRRANKVVIELTVCPLEECKVNSDVTVGFSMQFTYVNTVTSTPDKKEPQMHALTSRVYINLGKIKEKSG